MISWHFLFNKIGFAETAFSHSRPTD